MAKKTLKQRYETGLASRGWVLVQHEWHREKWQHPDHDYFIWCGNAGSVRFGKNKTTSIPVRQQFKDLLLWGTAPISTR